MTFHVTNSVQGLRFVTDGCDVFGADFSPSEIVAYDPAAVRQLLDQYAVLLSAGGVKELLVEAKDFPVFLLTNTGELVDDLDEVDPETQYALPADVAEPLGLDCGLVVEQGLERDSGCFDGYDWRYEGIRIPAHGQYVLASFTQAHADARLTVRLVP